MTAINRMMYKYKIIIFWSEEDNTNEMDALSQDQKAD